MPERDVTKDVLRMFNYGLYVAATMTEEGPRAATVSWVSQVSFEPRLIVVAMRKGTIIHNSVQASRRFVLHVAGGDQPEFAKAFFRISSSNGDQIAGYHFTLRSPGLPVIDAAMAWLECEVTEEAGMTGDHALFIARVTGSGVHAPGVQALALRDTPWHYGG